MDGNGVDVYRWLTQFARMACDMEFGISFLKEIPSIKMEDVLKKWERLFIAGTIETWTHTHTHVLVLKFVNHPHLMGNSYTFNPFFFSFFGIREFVVTWWTLLCPKHLPKRLTDQNPSKSLRWPERTPRVTLTAEPQNGWAERKMILPLKGWSFNWYWYQCVRFFLEVFWDIPDGFQQLEDVGGFVRIWTECFICQHVKKRHPIQNPAKKTNCCLVSVSSLLLERLHP